MTDTKQSTSSGLAVHPGHWVPAVDNRQDIDLIRQTYAKTLNNNELELLVAHGNQMGLSVIKKQIYGIKRGDQMSIQVGIDGYRAITESNPDFMGYEGPEWCGPDGQWVDVWLNPEPPRAARMGIYRKGFAKPIWGVAVYDEFVQTFYDKYTKSQKPNSMWQKMPANQLAKCAEAQAHRKATPGVLGGTEMYDEDSPEVEQVQAMGVETTVTVSGGSAADEWNKANRRLRAIAAQYKVPDEHLGLYPKVYKKDSLKDLTAQQLNALANSMSTAPEKIEPYFADLVAKYGSEPATHDEEVEAGSEPSDDVEDTYEGEFQEVTEDGEIIPEGVGRGNFQSPLIDVPLEHPNHGDS